MDRRYGVHLRMFGTDRNPWRHHVVPCPFCQTPYALDDPTSTPPEKECQHFVYRRSTFEAAFLLFGRDSFVEMRDAFPALTYIREDAPEMVAAYPQERQVGQLDPLVEALADGWQIRVATSDDGTFDDVFIEGARDRVVARVEEIIEELAFVRVRGWKPWFDAGRASGVTDNTGGGGR